MQQGILKLWDRNPNPKSFKCLGTQYNMNQESISGRPIQVRLQDGLLVPLEEGLEPYGFKDFTVISDKKSFHFGITLDTTDRIMKISRLAEERPELFDDPDFWRGAKEPTFSELMVHASRSDAIGARQKAFSEGNPARDYALTLFTSYIRSRVDLCTRVYVQKIDLERYGSQRNSL